MRERLLIVGAEPRAFTGPWIELSDSEVWEVLPRGEFHEGDVSVEAQNGAALLTHPLTKEPVRLEQVTKVRAIVSESAKSKRITVILRQVG